MTKTEAREILAKNCLDLTDAGLDNFPGVRVQLGLIRVSNEKNNGLFQFGINAVEIFAFCDRHGRGRRRLRHSMFMICYNWKQCYYRQFFEEIDEVIQALRVVEDFDDDKDV